MTYVTVDVEVEVDLGLIDTDTLSEYLKEVTPNLIQTDLSEHEVAELAEKYRLALYQNDPEAMAQAAAVFFDEVLGIA